MIGDRCLGCLIVGFFTVGFLLTAFLALSHLGPLDCFLNSLSILRLAVAARHPWKFVVLSAGFPATSLADLFRVFNSFDTLGGASPLLLLGLFSF